jgi:hypothetical protein
MSPSNIAHDPLDAINHEGIANVRSNLAKLADRNRSGLSVAAWCRENAEGYHRFLYGHLQSFQLV